MPFRRAPLRSDLRRVSRAPVARHPLGELVRTAGTAPDEARLWLADAWPWTTATGAAISTLRPRWAAAVIDIVDVRAHGELGPEEAVRELNRSHDPWPEEMRRALDVK